MRKELTRDEITRIADGLRDVAMLYAKQALESDDGSTMKMTQALYLAALFTLADTCVVTVDWRKDDIRLDGSPLESAAQRRNVLHGL